MEVNLYMKPWQAPWSYGDKTKILMEELLFSIEFLDIKKMK